MDLVYEVTLLGSLASGAIALALALLARVPTAHAIASARWSLRLAIGAWAALLVSVTVHLWWGHRPGGPQALPALEFASEHRAFVVAAVIPSLALVFRARRPGDLRRREG